MIGLGDVVWFNKHDPLHGPRRLKGLVHTKPPWSHVIGVMELPLSYPPGLTSLR